MTGQGERLQTERGEKLIIGKKFLNGIWDSMKVLGEQRGSGSHLSELQSRSVLRLWSCAFSVDHVELRVWL